MKEFAHPPRSRPGRCARAAGVMPRSLPVRWSVPGEGDLEERWMPGYPRRGRATQGILRPQEVLMASGITGKLLHVDLTSRQTRTEEMPEPVMRKFLGGGALAAHILLRDLPPGVDPLGPDNVLVLMTSVINGLSLSGSNRYTAAAKSPLTGGYGESEAGGWWGPELRAAGWDGVVIRGKAQ